MAQTIDDLEARIVILEREYGQMTALWRQVRRSKELLHDHARTTANNTGWLLEHERRIEWLGEQVTASWNWMCFFEPCSSGGSAVSRWTSLMIAGRADATRNTEKSNVIVSRAHHKEHQ
jgi:hypothetical protein